MSLSELVDLYRANEKVFRTPKAQRSSGQSQRFSEIQAKADQIVAGWDFSVGELHALRGQSASEMDVIYEEVKASEGRKLTASQLTEYEENEFAYEALNRALDGETFDPNHSLPAMGGAVSFQGDPFSPVAHETDGQVLGRALRSVELWRADDDLKETATRTLEHLADDDRRGVSKHLLLYGSPAYSRAFAKWVSAPETFAAELESDEHEAWVEGQRYQRATLQLSGAVVPSPLDPTIVLTNDGVINPMREICRVDSTISKSKRYISSAGSTFSFDAELAEASDDTHTENEITIEVHKAQGWIEASLEVAADQEEFSSELAKIIMDGKAQLEADKFITGTGTNEPTGIEVELAGGASVVSPATVEVFASADVYAVIEDLPPRFRARARWMAELSTINEVDQFETSNGAKLFDGLNQASPRLLRRALAENSSVDAHSDIDVAATAANHILYVGDWKNYVILDRVGLSVTFIPPGHLKGAGGRPDGRVGWYAYWRVGGESLVDEAFRVLNIATTA